MFLVKSIDETIKIINNNFNDYVLNKRTIKLEDSLNFITVNDVVSLENVPHFDRSIVDGYAVDFNSVKLASNTTPSILKLAGEVLMGEESNFSVTLENTVYVPTGGHLPTGANSVVMIENTDTLNDEVIINKSVSMWENVLKMGTDIQVDSELISANTKITPLVIGALKAVGIEDIEVFDFLKATLISTGDEIVEKKRELAIGEIRDINTFTISNQLLKKNIIVNDSLIINDDFESYKQAVINGFKKSDIVISSGGSSVGDKDYTFDILKDMGAEILVHGVNIKPGKPTIIAKYNNKMFLGLPGQPTSAFFVLNTFIDEIIKTIYQIDEFYPVPYIEAVLDQNVHSVSGKRMYQLVKISKGLRNEIIATPLFAKSGMINALKEASGYIIIDEFKEGITSGEIVKVYRLGDYMKRSVYLNTIDLKEIDPIIDNLLKNQINNIQYEEVKTVDSINRITFEAVYAKASSPCYNASAMDGIVLSASKTYSATESTPVTIDKNDYEYINTGNIIPDIYNAVVMIEDVKENSNGSITLIKSVRPYQDIRPIGEDIVMEDMILPKHHKIRPIDISALLSGGIGTILVIKKPQVAIIPTGDEIISDINELEKGKIIDSNSYYIKNEISLLGGEANIFSIQKDQFDTLEETIINATKTYDLVIIGAGSSAGSKDYAKSIIEKNGEVYVHGISIKPGKPTIIGSINNVPVIGLPGYPVSTYMAFEFVVKQIILKLLNQDEKPKTVIKAKLTKKVYSSLKNHEYVRVKLGVINDEYIATPLNRGAGVTMSLVKADGMLVIEKNLEGYEEMSLVDIHLLKDIEEVRNSLIVIGSHDILLDKIDDLMSNEKYHLSSSHVGSFGGIMAIKNKGCHIAPVHILHESGEYNKFIIDKYLDNDYSLVRGVSRIQGLYLKKGNPKNIKSLKDLAREDVTFVNRQRGSGTRILLDYELKNNKINNNDIVGYDFELSTHMLVASHVKDSRFDTGMGVLSVANINDLDFIEIAQEHYDFIVLNEIIDTPIYKQFIKVLKSNEFKAKLDELGGYDISNIGEIIYTDEVID